MKIEIWSDKVCPFCYIGKRKFEMALEDFEHRDKLEVTWKSFQLDPDSHYVEGKSIYEALAEKKGLSVEQSRKMSQQVAAIGSEVGLNINFDITVPANTFDAHRLTHFAADHNLQSEAEELLFRSYFVEGKNLEDKAFLVEAGTQIGLEPEATKEILNSDRYGREVSGDIEEAAALGVRGVPFFVLNRQYAISGAQSPETFLNALRQAWGEYSKEQKFRFVDANTVDGDSCTPGEDCN